MQKLKDSIIEKINHDYPKISKKEKSLLSHLALKSIFNSEHYKNCYYATSVAYNETNREYYIAMNEYNTGSQTQSRSLYSIKYDYNDLEDWNDIKKYLVEPDVYSRLKTFIDISRNSDDINSYTNKLIEAHKGDNNFLSTINSFGFLFSDLDSFITKDVIKLLSDNNIETFYSELCKKEINLYAGWGYKEKTIEELNQSWIKNKEYRDEMLNESETLFENISDYNHKYIDKINNIVEQIKEERPFLFRKTSMDDISFSYYEVKAKKEKYNHKLELETDFAINKEILQANNVSISEVYNIEQTEDSYQYLEKYFHKVLNKDNEISNSLHSRFFGLDFLNRTCIEPHLANTSYLVAQANNEVIGFFSFRSSQYDSKSLFKSIEYVCIKDNFRSIGLVESMYEKAITMLKESGNILTNSCYTIQGSKKLPKMKQRLREKHPDFLLIDTDAGKTLHMSKNDEKAYKIKISFNYDFVGRIRYYEEQGLCEAINKNADMIKNCYRGTIKSIQDTLGDDPSENDLDTFSIRQDALQQLSEIIEKPVKKRKIKI